MRGGYLLLVFASLAGCASTREFYPYRVTTGNCLCERFETRDSRFPVAYEFSASYRVDEVIATQIVVDMVNESQDTLDLSLAFVKVASRNISYVYNDKFLPIQIPYVLPGGRRRLTLVGEAVKREVVSDPWLKIAGEELVVTLKGMRLRERTLSPQVVTFVPFNPKLRTDTVG
jgi:hypothetical protein